MGITTKVGDKGMTSLYFGGMVKKDDLRVEVYGTLDELCSFLGMSKSLIKDRITKKLIESIQRDLFVIGGEIATKAQFLNRLENRIDGNYVRRLEKNIKKLEAKSLFEGCGFYLPGENFISSTFDVARTIARRAERMVATLKSKGLLKNPNILIYLNRLSDLLYLLARDQEKRHRKLRLR